MKYLRLRPVEYYLDKDLVDNYDTATDSKLDHICPNCKSDNVSYGYAIDYQWDIPYLFLSLLIFGPLPPIRKKYHCFDCGHNYKFKNHRN